MLSDSTLYGRRARLSLTYVMGSGGGGFTGGGGCGNPTVASGNGVGSPINVIVAARGVGARDGAGHRPTQVLSSHRAQPTGT